MVSGGPTRSLPGWPIPLLGGLGLLTLAWASFPSPEDWLALRLERLPGALVVGWFVVCVKFRRITARFRQWDVAGLTPRMRRAWLGLQGWGCGGLPGTGPESILWPWWHLAYHGWSCPETLRRWMAVEWLVGFLFGLIWFTMIQGAIPLGWLGCHGLLVLLFLGGFEDKGPEVRKWPIDEILRHFLVRWVELMVLAGLASWLVGGESSSVGAWVLSLGWAFPAWCSNWKCWDWQGQTVPPPVSPADLCVLVPTLNERAPLPLLWKDLERARNAGVRVLVVDGGSTDGTVEWAKEKGVEVLTTRRGRGNQMESGWRSLPCLAYWFLHADCRVEGNGYLRVLEALRDPRVVGGGGWKRFDHFHPMLLGSRARCWLRLMLWGWILGDQGFFIRRDCLEKTGGWRDWPVMEDVAMSESAGLLGDLVLADYGISTSIRRFERHGMLGTYRVMWRLVRDYRQGRYPLDQWYQRYPEGSRRP